MLDDVHIGALGGPGKEVDMSVMDPGAGEVSSMLRIMVMLEEVVVRGHVVVMEGPKESILKDLDIERCSHSCGDANKATNAMLRDASPDHQGFLPRFPGFLGIPVLECITSPSPTILPALRPCHGELGLIAENNPLPLLCSPPLNTSRPDPAPPPIKWCKVGDLPTNH